MYTFHYPSFPQSFARIKKWLEHAKTSPNLSILAGGGCDDSVGYFVEPCIVESQDPTDPIMKEVRKVENTGGGSTSWAARWQVDGY